MRFDLTDLRLFVHIVEAGSITAGAGRNNLTLAAASGRIRGMEESLGTALLGRHPRGVVPTPAGETLLRHARAVLDQMERLKGDLSAHARGLRGYVRILANTAAIRAFLTVPLAEYLAAHPQVDVDLEEMLVAVLPCGHKLAGRRNVAFSDIVEDPFVGLPAGSALQDHLTAHAARLGKRLSYRVRLPSFDGICHLVAAGAGVGVVPLSAVKKSAKLHRVPLTDPWATRHLVIATKSVRALSIHGQTLTGYLSASPP